MPRLNENKERATNQGSYDASKERHYRCVAGATAFGQHRKDLGRHDGSPIPQEYPPVLAEQRGSG